MPHLIREDLIADRLEAICIEIIKPKSKPFLDATWYRPPTSKVEWFQDFENFLQLCDDENKEINITGDFNCDFIEVNTNTAKLIDLMDIFQLQQHIKNTQGLSLHHKP